MPEDTATLMNGNVYECDGQVTSAEQFDTSLIGTRCVQVLHYNGLD